MNTHWRLNSSEKRTQRAHKQSVWVKKEISGTGWTWFKASQYRSLCQSHENWRHPHSRRVQPRTRWYHPLNSGRLTRLHRKRNSSQICVCVWKKTSNLKYFWCVYKFQSRINEKSTVEEVETLVKTPDSQNVPEFNAAIRRWVTAKEELKKSSQAFLFESRCSFHHK